LIPVLFLAAMVGAREGGQETNAAVVSGPMWRATATAWAGCAVASMWLGSAPWCQATPTDDVIGQTYANAGMTALEDRLSGSEGIKTLHEVVARVGREGASVLATGRIAAHLVGAERLDTVGQAPQRWAAFEAEAGSGRSGIELFDWVVIDTYERFYQSQENTAFVLAEARRADYRIVEDRRGIVVLARPGL
jgi:hypothetical protein